jgi:hypothetical protein
MVSRGVNVMRIVWLVSVVGCLVSATSVGSPAYAQGAGSSTPGAPAGVAAPPGAVAPAVTPAAAMSPTSGPEAEATAKAKRAAEAACKKVVAAVGTGDLSALKTLPAEKRAALEKESGVSKIVSCLAVADGNSRVCGSLPKSEEQDCVKNVQLFQELKSPPKSGAPPTLLVTAMVQNCMEAFSKAECEKMRDAWMTRDASKCKGLPKELSDGCAAVATGDPSRCPQGNPDCQNLIKVQKEGLKALPMKEAINKAAVNGKREECRVLQTELEERCSEEKKPEETKPGAPQQGEPKQGEMKQGENQPPKEGAVPNPAAPAPANPAAPPPAH